MPLVKQKATTVTVGEEQRRRERDCLSLVRQLSDENPAARRWAAKDLVNCPDASAALADLLRHEEEHSVREAILTALTHLGGEQAVAGLVECLRSEDASLRNEAIEALKQLPDDVAPYMDRLLADSDPDVRIFGVNVLESLRHELVEDWLREVIEHDPHVNVCAAALDLISEVGSAGSREAVERLRARFPEEPYIRFAADLALKRIAIT